MTIPVPLRASLVLVLALLGSGCSREPAWNVLIVTFDTTRADRIAGYGEGNHTPHLARLAAEGVLFANALTTVPITAPSHATILTGKYPIRHGVRDNGLFVLAQEHQTLAEILGERGYRTGAAVGSFPLGRQFGLDQGFQFFDDHIEGKREDFLGIEVRAKEGLFFDERPAAQVNDALVGWLRKEGGEPFFAWAHYFDPHQPYDPKPPYDELFVHDPYRAEIAYADESFGTLVGELERLGVWDRTLVVFVADHGEGLGEHRETTHSMVLYQGTLHVPLIIRAPTGPRGVVIDERVSTADIVPTVLALLGIDPPSDLDGSSLASAIAEGDEPAPRALYAETLSPRLAHRWGELRAIVDGGHKYVFGPRPELFDLSLDPKETRDLVVESPAKAEELQRKLARTIHELGAENPVQPGAASEETRLKLEALGYLTSAATESDPIEERLRGDGPAPQDRVADVSKLSSAKEFLFKGQFRTAAELLQQLLETSPGSPFYLELLASAQVGLGDFDAAAAILEQIRETYPDPAVLARHELRLAGMHMQAGDWERVLEHCKKSLSLRPQAQAEYVQALAYRELDGSHESENYVNGLVAALELDPLFVPARVEFAVASIQRGDAQLGEQHLLQAMEDYPFYPKTYFNYGRLALEYGEWEEALENFRRAVQLDPRYLAARYAAVAVLVDQGDLESARAELAALRTVAPQSPEAAAATSLFPGASP